MFRGLARINGRLSKVSSSRGEHSKKTGVGVRLGAVVGVTVLVAVWVGKAVCVGLGGVGVKVGLLAR
ncbi:protein of unknown function [Brevefilum fermentans]|uniref:Uncharacterized protein n=1 Tax=Candidatus Brevifilum fermentans TaxID=1986204 RepID=A0A1Y6K4Y8_9CHLR|nr:protein of unknown function [Brevefilum fermentans]